MLRIPKITKKNTVPSAPAPVPLGESPQKNRAFVVSFVLGVLLLVSLGIAGYFYYQYKQTGAVKEAAEIEKIIEVIGHSIQLPEGEVPTLATVTDKEKLVEPFFQKAENGDQILIYTENGKVILYRPSIRKVIDMTSVNISASQAQAKPVSQSEAVPVIVRVAILNGTQTAGAANAAESKLELAFPNIAVVTKANAMKRNYTETVVVDVTGKNVDMAKDIATTLEASVASLPSGEKAPSDADIVIILGVQEEVAPPTTQTNPAP